MQFHRGRLVDHIHLRVADLDASKNFYRAVFAALGHEDALQEGPGFFHADELFVDKPMAISPGFISLFRRPIAKRCNAFIWQRLRRAVGIMARRANGLIIPATLARSSWILMETISRPSFMDRPSAVRPRW